MEPSKNSVAPKNLHRENLELLTKDLYHHPIYKLIQTEQNLRKFMEIHCYVVWNFMSLVKYLQNYLAPTDFPWLPDFKKNTIYKRFINEIVLVEESDKIEFNDLGDEMIVSHVELYIEAMKEVKAESKIFEAFLRNFEREKPMEYIKNSNIPKAAKDFIEYDFKVILNNQPHQIASLFCYGRENIIPQMFQSILKNNNMLESEFPIMHTYLARHIEVDGDEHGPLSEEILDMACGDDTKKWEEAEQTALETIENRIQFFDNIVSEIIS